MRIDRVEIRQGRLPGTDGAEAALVLHAVTDRNFTARITVARRSPEQSNRRYHDYVATKADLARIIRELQARHDLLTDAPAGTVEA